MALLLVMFTIGSLSAYSLHRETKSGLVRWLPPPARMADSHCLYNTLNPPVWAPDTPVIPLWAFLGFSGLFWAFLGFSGLFWAFLGFSGLFWAFLGFSGLFWAFLGFSGLFWAFLGFSGLFWAFLGFSGLFWAFLGFSGLAWTMSHPTHPHHHWRGLGTCPSTDEQVPPSLNTRGFPLRCQQGDLVPDWPFASTLTWPWVGGFPPRDNPTTHTGGPQSSRHHVVD